MNALAFCLDDEIWQNPCSSVLVHTGTSGAKDLLCQGRRCVRETRIIFAKSSGMLAVVFVDYFEFIFIVGAQFFVTDF